MFVRGKEEISRTRSRYLLEGRKKSRGRVRAVCKREGRNFEDACALLALAGPAMQAIHFSISPSVQWPQYINISENLLGTLNHL